MLNLHVRVSSSANIVFGAPLKANLHIMYWRASEIIACKKKKNSRINPTYFRACNDHFG